MEVTPFPISHLRLAIKFDQRRYPNESFSIVALNLAARYDLVVMQIR